MKKTTVRIAITLVAFAVSIVLTGCTAANLSTASPASAASNGHVIKGIVHGGQQPVTGANLYLYAAGNTGYGSAATSLLDPTVAGVLTDGNSNGYIQTDGNGNFNMSGDYATTNLPCPSGRELYMVAYGGDPTPGVPNTGAVLMVMLGTCSQLESTSFIWMNERTTVAAAWAMAPFMSGPANIGTSSGNAAGLVSASTMAINLVNTATGSVGGAGLPAGATLPSDKINALADILAVCINSATGSGNCNTLFTNATTGPTVTDTTTAAMYMAQNPGTNVHNLYGLLPGTPVFATGLSSQPNDWTLAVNFTGAGTAPAGIAVDSSGNLWLPNPSTNMVTELSSAGAVVGSYATGSGTTTPVAVAIDSSNNVWVANAGNNTVAELSNGSYTIAQTCSSNGLNDPTGITLDNSSNVWVTDKGNSEISVFTSTCGTLAGSPFSGNGLGSPIGIATTSH